MTWVKDEFPKLNKKQIKSKIDFIRFINKWVDFKEMLSGRILRLIISIDEIMIYIHEVSV